MLLFLQANVLMSHDDKPKLADFGLTITQESKLRFSETDPAGGTLRWMVSEPLALCYVNRDSLGGVAVNHRRQKCSGPMDADRQKPTCMRLEW